MPFFYSHYSFARRNIAALPESARALVEAHIGYYDTGAQGPDPFFYYVMGKKSEQQYAQAGSLLQGTRVAEGMRELMYAAASDERAKAYFLGYLCHYALDCAAHPYILSIVCDPDHSRYETQLDAALWRAHGGQGCFVPASVFPKKWECDVVLDELWTPILKKMGLVDGPGVFAKALALGRRTLSMMYDPHRVKLALISPLEAMMGKKYAYTGRVFFRECDGGLDLMNMAHAPWVTPWGGKARTESYLELYEQGLEDAKHLTHAALEGWDSGDFQKALKTIGSRDFGTALEGEQPLELETSKCIYGNECCKCQSKKR